MKCRHSHPPANLLDDVMKDLTGEGGSGTEDSKADRTPKGQMSRISGDGPTAGENWEN
jgi:hypothetical protein